MVRLIHSSDIHVEDPGPHAPPRNAAAGLGGLAAVLETARSCAADLVVLAGDTFDHGRIALPTLQRAADLLAAAGRLVVLLPGNHDAVLDDCLFRRAGLPDIPGVAVLGVGMPEHLSFEELELEIWGRAHRGCSRLEPLGAPPPRRLRWQVAVAHGHYVPPEDWSWQSHRAWRIADAALAQTSADYIALGHWDRAVRVGPEAVQAWYSGAPDLAGTVNMVTFDEAGVTVLRQPLHDAKGGGE